MCKESNEDDTEETLQKKQLRALTSIQLVYSCVFTFFKFTSTLIMFLCLLFCAFVSLIQSSSVFPRIHFSPVCEFLAIPCNCSHCENGSLLTRRHTLRSILEKDQPFSTVHIKPNLNILTTKLHWPTPSTSHRQVHRSPNPSQTCPSSHWRYTFTQKQQKTDVLLLRCLHFIHSITRRAGRISTWSQTILPQVRLSTSPWTNLCCLSRRDTLRSIFEKGQLFSAVHTISRHLYLHSGLLQVQRSPNPSRHNHQDTQRETVTCTEAWLVWGRPRVVARQSTTIRCRRAGETEYHEPLSE